MENIKCGYCGKEKEDQTFVIGASNVPDWVMMEGTGKMTCPSSSCFNRAELDAATVVNRYVASIKQEGSE